MSYLTELLIAHGAALLFAWVLLEQLGLPIPALPALLLAGSMAATGVLSFPLLVGSAVAACLVADTVWYLGGRRYGGRVLRLICRLSLTPDTCVIQSNAFFDRWGAPCLMVAKFVPGLASIVNAMAGAVRVNLRDFLFYDLIGSALWSGLGLGLGYLLAPGIADLLKLVDDIAVWALAVIALCTAIYVGSKAWIRYRSQRGGSVNGLTVSDLASLRERGEEFILVDARTQSLWERERVVGSLPFNSPRWKSFINEGAAGDSRFVIYCDCMNEVTSSIVAKELARRGFKRAQPLVGGLSALRLAGYVIEGTDFDRPLGRFA